MFHELKAIAEAKLEGQRVVDCVISCPPYWTDGQRRAMLDAANIAGLNVLRLMNETTAVALNYGLLRKLPTEKSQEVLFVDMGHSSFNTAVVSFIDKKLTVLSTASDEHLGGRSFDLLLLNRFATEIKAKHNLDVLSNVKATLKLMKECGRVKKVLSANSECRYAVEYIMNDTDVQGTITRQEFEEMAAPLIERMNAPLKRVLERAGKKIEDLHSLEVVGGAHRIPMVQKVLSDFFGNPVSKTCDGDESVARGCALQCAMLG